MTQKSNYSNLNHLTEQETDDLIRKYYSHVRIKDLLDEYGLSVNPGQLLGLFPPKETKSLCPYCGVNMLRHFESRGHSSYEDGEIVCPNCNHNDKQFYCKCHNCRQAAIEKERQEYKEKYEAIKAILDKTRQKAITPAELTFTDKIYLGSLLRIGLSEDFNIINPVDSFHIPLAPTRAFSSEIVDNLNEKNIIGISLESHLDYFSDLNLEEGTISFWSDKIKWEILIQMEGKEKVEFIDSLMNPEYDNWPEEALDLWRKVALNECLEYLYYNLSSVLGVTYNAGSKTISILSELLKTYSASQIFGLIYRATNNALRFRAERGVNRKHAANAVIGNAQNFAERALINNWTINKYNRPRECPQSEVSKFLYNRVLKIGDDGFHEPPEKKISISQ
jgi:hypothetical protein